MPTSESSDIEFVDPSQAFYPELAGLEPGGGDQPGQATAADPGGHNPPGADDPARWAEHEGMAEDPPPPPPAQPAGKTSGRTSDRTSGKTSGKAAKAAPSLAALASHGVGVHLEELQKRLVIAVAVFVPLFVVGMLLYQSLWKLVTLPLERAAPHLLRFQALGPSDGLVMAMRISFAFALFLSLPVLLGQVWAFVAPGLTAREKRLLYLSLGTGGVLFFIGAALCYFVGLPLALAFLLPFNQSLEGWENAFTGPGYVDFVITCLAGFGLAFEMPLVMLGLGWAGIITPRGIREWWKAIVLIIVVLAAVMTPPDPFTQTLLALPMLGLFAAGYLLVKWVAGKED